MLDNYINQSTDAWIRERAKLALELQSMFECGDITQADYKELIEDIIRTEAIAEQGDDVELKSNFIKALSVISKAL
tara:strand:- start:447 stop:674 length:228 start_codon:yes stop_codon:yes gene_type:complete